MSKKCSAKAESKPCAKSSFAACEGCHQPFCLPHLNAHQQELAVQMEAIISEHDLLHEELKKPRIQSQDKMPNFVHEFGLIDTWQRRTLAQVTKIVTQEADRARSDIRTIIETNKYRANSNIAAITEEFERLKKRLTKLSEQLQEKMNTSEYLEPDLRQWQSELSDIKRSSITPRIQTRVIVNKLTVRETRQIQINASNILDVVSDDPERSEASNNNKKTNRSMEEMGIEIPVPYNYNAKSNEDLYDDGFGEVLNTSNNTYRRTTSAEAEQTDVLFNTKNIPQLADYSSLNAIYQLFIHSTNSDLRSSIYNNDNDEYMPPPINLVVEDPMVQLSMDSGSLYPRLSSENISDDDGFGALRPAANSYLSWDLEDS